MSRYQMTSHSFFFLDDKPFLTHGAGKWLTDNEANTYAKEHPGKGHICEFTDDKSLVVLEVALK